MTADCEPAPSDSARRFKVQVRLDYAYAEPTDVLLQVEAANLPGQALHGAILTLGETSYAAPMTGHGGIGTRHWLRLVGTLSVAYEAIVQLDRLATGIGQLSAVPPHRLPGDVVDYLMPSRYCPSDQFHDVVGAHFDGLTGGAMIAAMRDWVERRLTYASGASHAGTTASDSLASGQGVCRDYAHLLIALARAAWIPARYACVYAPDVKPQDFHAVVQVYLDDAWHLIDPTGMAAPEDMIVIGVGRDAGDVPFLSSFGEAEFVQQRVTVLRINNSAR
jgi:transglutaminase-like putative cysteine protease